MAHAGQFDRRSTASFARAPSGSACGAPLDDPSLEQVSAVEFGVKAFCEVTLGPAKVRGIGKGRLRSYHHGVLDLLRSVWDEPRPPDAPRRVWRDWVLVAALAVIVVLEGALQPNLPWRTASLIVALGLPPTLLWRRTRPLLMDVIAFVVAAVMPMFMGGSLGLYAMAFLLILPYALFRWGSGREAAVSDGIRRFASSR